MQNYNAIHGNDLYLQRMLSCIFRNLHEQNETHLHGIMLVVFSKINIRKRALISHQSTAAWLARQLAERQSAVQEVEGSSPRPDRTNTQGLKITEENVLPF